MADGPIAFIVKDLRAKELPLTIDDGLRTIGDLREVAHRRWLLPTHMIRFACNGRSCWEDQPDGVMLEQIIPKRDCPPILWLLWMDDSDHFLVDRTGRMTMVPEEDVDRKEREMHAANHPVTRITLRQWRMMTGTAIARCEACLTRGEEMQRDEGGDILPPDTNRSRKARRRD